MSRPVSDIVVLDFETTGAVAGFNNVPWQLGCVLLRDGQLSPQQGFSTLLRVPSEQPFNLYAPGRWGQLRSELAQAPVLLELWPRLRRWLSGRILAAHNVPCERSLLCSHFPMHHFGPWIDSLPLARLVFPGLPSYSLEELSVHLGLTDKLQAYCPGLEPHDAFYDACACALLLQKIMKLPSWQQMDAVALSRLTGPKSAK